MPDLPACGLLQIKSIFNKNPRPRAERTMDFFPLSACLSEAIRFRESALEASVLLVEGACRIYAPLVEVATRQKSCLSFPPV